MSMSGTKTPEEIKDYSIDWSKDLTTDTITSSAWSVAPSDASISSSTIAASGTLTTVWLAGGTANQVYVVRNVVNTAGGRELEKSFRLLVTANNYL